MSLSHQSSQRRRSGDVFSEFTGFFLKSLAAPTEERPTVRCISRADALHLAGTAREVLDDPKLRRVSADRLLDLLVTSGVLERLSATERTTGNIIYAVGPGSGRTVEPMELLAAAVPNGVICYFTALAYYGFTTQLPTHHHIAKLTTGSAQGTARPRPARSVSEDARGKLKRDQLGTRLFEFEGLPYYQTARARHTLAGMQLRQLNDRSVPCMTTREQTLLDTLLRPMSCGGPTVVWEAWSRPITDLDLDRFTQHLLDLDDPKLARRVGYMFDRSEFVAQGSLANILRGARQNSTIIEPIPLLPGLIGGRVDPVWQVQVATS